MTASSAGATPEISYAIEYQSFGGEHNRQFKGKGRLTIRSDGPIYIFDGQRRRLFSSKTVSTAFSAGDIANVTVAGRMIHFQPQAATGRAELPFVFFCRDEAEARTIASLLPTRTDADFDAARDFFGRLHRLAGARSPWSSVTNIIIALNVLAFVLMGLEGAGWFEVESMLPYLRYGANNGAATTDGEWWRLLTSMFLHYGFIHLLLNMWALFQAGHFLEKLQGRRLFALTYLASGLAGGFTSIAWHGDKVWSAGASGAVFGVYGAILGYLLREKQGLPRAVFQPMLKSSLTFAGYNILYGLVHPGIDNAAHTGGVVAGLVFGWLLAIPVDAGLRRQRTLPRLGLGLAALAVLVAAGIAVTPRFNYNVAEELAWSDANEPFFGKEEALLKKQNEGLAALADESAARAHADWMEGTLIPFYQGWHRAIAGIHLAAGRETAQRQRIVDHYLNAKVTHLQQLANGLRAGDAEAVDRFHDAEEAALKETGSQP